MSIMYIYKLVCIYMSEREGDRERERERERGKKVIS